MKTSVMEALFKNSRRSTTRNLIKTVAPALVLSCEFCQTFHESFFEEEISAIVSIILLLIFWDILNFSFSGFQFKPLMHNDSKKLDTF